MNVLSIEKARNELTSYLGISSSRTLKLKRITDFFTLLLDTNSSKLIESYLVEFISQYIDYFKSYSPFGASPAMFNKIIAANERLISTDELDEYRDRLITLNFNVKDKFTEFEKLLAGEKLLDYDRKILFPVIEEEEQKLDDPVFGAVDSITIKINKRKNNDKFIVVPSESEKDKKLDQQISISWLKAKEYCNKYVSKISEHHEVIISFDEHLAIYRGESVGVALTIGFIEELLRVYNSQTILNPISRVVFTGGITEKGQLNQISKEVVEKKVELTFFSNCSILVVPKIDEIYAAAKLEELRLEYSKRNFEIVGMKSLDEILLRRDLVDIKKQKLIVRTGKFVIKNWASAVATVLLAVLLAFLFVMDLDDNPVMIEHDGFSILVKNKKGRVLWTKNLMIELESNSRFRIHNVAYPVDINSDGINEVLICQEDLRTYQGFEEMNKISCYDNNGDLIWNYQFHDSIRTYNQIHSRAYSADIIGVNEEADGKVVYCLADNHPLYPSAVFRLSAKTGKRLKGEFWNAGHIVSALLGDFNNDKKKEIVGIGLHNGFNATILFSIDIKNLNGQSPAIGNYKFIDLPEAEMNSYILILPSDLTKYYNIRLNYPLGASFNYNKSGREFRFMINEGSYDHPRGVHYVFGQELKSFSVSTGNDFEEERDMLIRGHKLPPPKTNSVEYSKMLEDKILFWKNGQWVKREELDCILP